MLLKINGENRNQALKRLYWLYGPCFCVPVAVAGIEKELGAVVVSPAVGQGMSCTKMLLTDVPLTVFLTSTSLGNFMLFLAQQEGEM